MIKNRQGGFTLIELIVAISLMGLIIVGLTNLYITVETLQRKSYHLEIATRAGEKQIESLRNSQYGALVPDTTLDFSADLPAELPDPKSASFYVSEPELGLRRVDITISYKDGGGTKTVKQSSFIGIIGIGQ
jgi:prepilin-type N-terminal cleavage/methylation domain-containing protein